MGFSVKVTLIKGKPHAKGLEIIAPPGPLLICSCSFLRIKIDAQKLALRPTGTAYLPRRKEVLGEALAGSSIVGRGFGVRSQSLHVET